MSDKQRMPRISIRGGKDGACPECGGTGYVMAQRTCQNCGGTGRVTCSDCGGRGYKMVERKCSHCNGRGYIIYEVPLIKALIGEY